MTTSLFPVEKLHSKLPLALCPAGKVLWAAEEMRVFLLYKLQPRPTLYGLAQRLL
jgi:hypothetical protein